MNKSVKLFMASLVILAAAIGFFAGSVCNKHCTKGPVVAEGVVPPGPHGDMDRHGPKGDFDKHGPHGKFGKGPSPEVIDSILQVTPEQKAALEKNRLEADSIFKNLRKNKFESEKALGEALDSGNAEAINAAKANVLEADKALLEHRIAGVANMSKILTAEQMGKFRNFHKEQQQKFKKMWEERKKPKGPKDEEPKN